MIRSIPKWKAATCNSIRTLRNAAPEELNQQDRRTCASPYRAQPRDLGNRHLSPRAQQKLLRVENKVLSIIVIPCIPRPWVQRFLVVCSQKGKLRPRAVPQGTWFHTAK